MVLDFAVGLTAEVEVGHVDYINHKTEDLAKVDFLEKMEEALDLVAAKVVEEMASEIVAESDFAEAQVVCLVEVMVWVGQVVAMVVQLSCAYSNMKSRINYTQQFEVPDHFV